LSHAVSPAPGHLHQVGRKFDRWLDIVILEQVLADTMRSA